MTMKKFFAAMSVAAVLIAVGGAQNIPDLTTIAVGIGNTPELALKEALASAVQQAVGTLIDARTMMKNDAIMEEQILSASDGFVKSFEKIGEARKNRQGLWQVKIQAVVLMKPLKRKLADTHILIQDTGSSGQNEWAKIISKEESRRDVPALISNFFRTHPVEKLLVPIVFDEKGRTEGLQLYFPESGRAVDNMVTVSLGVLVVVDTQKYQKQILPDLLFMLEKISSARGPKITSRSSKYDDVCFCLSPYDKTISTNNFDKKITLLKNARCERSIPGNLDRDYKDCVPLVVNVSRGKYRAGYQLYQVYFLPNDNKLDSRFSAERDRMYKLAVKLTFLNKEGDEVFSEIKPLGNALFKDIAMGRTAYLISPEFISDYSHGWYQLAKIFDFTCKIPVDDIREIAKVSASIVSE